MPRKRLKATVRYDGSGFSGWQVQPEQRTVQGVLEEALSQIATEPIRIIGAGRTDAGVHALAQVFSCDWPEERSLDTLVRSLSKMLGPEIRIERIEEVASDFHAIAAAVSKRYAYTLSFDKSPDPFSDQYAWCVPHDVDLKMFSDLCASLEGTHDFAGFQSSGSSVKTTVRTLHSVEVHKGAVVGPHDAEGLWRVDFHGDGFLYKMVRNIVGTLIDIARGKDPEEHLRERLDSPGPYQGYTAPAHGLTLIEVIY